MSRPVPAQSLRTPPQPTLPSARPTYRRPPQPRITSHTRSPTTPKAKPATTVTGKPLRTSKTIEKLVLLPSAPQTKPLLVPPGHGYPGAPEEDVLGYETDAGLVREYKSAAERMTKDQREKAGYNRITAYCLAEGMKMKLLAGFLKREHNVQPRVFDEAMYVVSPLSPVCSIAGDSYDYDARAKMYHLPLLPGYSPSTTVRSSTAFTKAHLSRLSEAEENGYQGSYFATPRPRSHEEVSRREDDGYVTEGREGGYVTEGSPIETRSARDPSHTLMVTAESDAEQGGETEADWWIRHRRCGGDGSSPQQEPEPESEEPVAEVVFFAYGVAVFYGFDEAQERSIIDDLSNAGIFRRMIKEGDWEIEECHFASGNNNVTPRLIRPSPIQGYTMISLHSSPHLTFLSSPLHMPSRSPPYLQCTRPLLPASSRTRLRSLFPRQLAESGALSLKRRDALRLTGRLFKLRRDVNLVSNVLDVPELFWTEASLGGLYESVREYMEVEGRVRALNEKLLVASDFLDVIHDHLNNSAMERITWIVIWYCLLVSACPFTDVGEVFARCVVDMPAPADGSRVGYAVVRGLMPRGGLVKMLIRVVDGVKRS
ncbi:hypothetical protein J3R83DRAFT_9859 [Lanmaoa asiatica]|nr:hypothetical protein J3R83DRAFT_9859 [Lanmaoa asiatica]